MSQTKGKAWLNGDKKKKKKDPYIYCLQETHLKTGEKYRLKLKGWKKIFHTNRDQMKARVVILISDKIDFKTKAVKRDKEGHYIMIKGSIQEENITLVCFLLLLKRERKNVWHLQHISSIWRPLAFLPVILSSFPSLYFKVYFI